MQPQMPAFVGSFFSFQSSAKTTPDSVLKQWGLHFCYLHMLSKRLRVFGGFPPQMRKVAVCLKEKKKDHCMIWFPKNSK